MRWLQSHDELRQSKQGEIRMENVVERSIRHEHAEGTKGLTSKVLTNVTGIHDDIVRPSRRSCLVAAIGSPPYSLSKLKAATIGGRGRDVENARHLIIDPNDILIMAVAHDKRRLGYWLRRKPE